MGELVNRIFEKVVEGIEVVEGKLSTGGAEDFWAKLPDEFTKYRLPNTVSGAYPAICHVNNSTLIIDKRDLVFGRSPKAVDSYRKIKNELVSEHTWELLEARVYSATQDAVDKTSEILLRECYTEVQEGDELAGDIVKKEKAKTAGAYRSSPFWPTKDPNSEQTLI